MKLFSYCIPFDDGAAPNPFWGVCSLAICKPKIRRAANVGDWIAGTGSRHSPIGDVSGELVYAMRVTAKLRMAAYDDLTKAELHGKIPVPQSGDPRRRVGDSIYDFSSPAGPRQRKGTVHDEREQRKDLSGEYVLLSTHFFYFGDAPIALPPFLQPIVNQRQGHKSHANDAYAEPFVEWIEGLGHPPGTLVGAPQGLEKYALTGEQSGCVSRPAKPKKAESVGSCSRAS